jgi:hypothetical protein
LNDPSVSNQPFQPETATPVRAGCSRFALFGCGGLLVLLLIAVGIFLFKAREITVWGFGLMEQQVMARLPAETTDEEARRVQRGFDAVVQAVEDDTIDPNALQQLQPVMMRFADPNNNPEPEDVARLIELLEAASGVTAAPVPVPAPPEAPSSALEPAPESNL